MIIKDLRTGETVDLTEEELKNFIIFTTCSVFENEQVKQEYTGKRPSAFNNFFVSEDYNTFKGIFLVTALWRINSDKNSRYMILTEYDYPDLVNYVQEYVPIFYVEHEISDDEVSRLSKWFRESMGNGFSFVDIDFLLANKNKTIVIEEKYFLGARLGFGQDLSYKELVKDVLINAYRIILRPSGIKERYIMDYYDKKTGSFKEVRKNADKNEIKDLISESMNRK